MNTSTDPPASNALFSLGTKPLTVDEAQNLAARAFGISGTVTLLTSERDQNFLLVSNTHADVGHMPSAAVRFVLKVSHAAESPDVTDFQTQAQLCLMHAKPALPVPHLMQAKNGSPVHWHEGDDGSQRAVRMNTFVSGRPMHELPRDTATSAKLGAALASFDAALSGFHHAAASQELLWDIQHAAKLRPLLKYITDEARHKLASRYLDHFEFEILPQLPALRRQVIHNDLNPYNVFINHDGTIGGIIDFGDMVEAPLINELAVACSYQLVPGDAPLAMAARCVSAYHAVMPLTSDELALLPDLIAIRMLLTVLITTWRASLYPENRTYILRNNPLSWQGLMVFEAMPPRAAQDIFFRACTL